MIESHDITKNIKSKNLESKGLDTSKHYELHRPKTFDYFVGQKRIIKNLKVYLQSAKSRDDVLDHILFSGPPGLGKTTLAYIIANELDVKIHSTFAPTIEHPGILAGLLTHLETKHILFIDEIHRLPKLVQETLYSAMEDYKINIYVGEGSAGENIEIKLPKFTLIGATTHAGMLTPPFRTRFKIDFKLNFYEPKDLKQIILNYSEKNKIKIDQQSANLLSKCSRGTPRIANNLLLRVRDFAEVDKSSITKEITKQALVAMEIDMEGLTLKDRTYLEFIRDNYDGGPVGLNTLSAGLSENKETITEVYEPYLLQKGFINRTSTGRILTKKGYKCIN